MEIKKPTMSKTTKKKLNELFLMLKSRTHTKAEVMAHFCVTERTAREMISTLSKKVPVIATSDNCGYRIATTANDIEAVTHSWKEIDSRQKELEERKKPLIKFYEKQNAKRVEG